MELKDQELRHIRNMLVTLNRASFKDISMAEINALEQAKINALEQAKLWLVALYNAGDKALKDKVKIKATQEALKKAKIKKSPIKKKK
jgi:hypothetical protein